MFSLELTHQLRDTFPFSCFRSKKSSPRFTNDMSLQHRRSFPPLHRKLFLPVRSSSSAILSTISTKSTLHPDLISPQYSRVCRCSSRPPTHTIAQAEGSLEGACFPPGSQAVLRHVKKSKQYRRAIGMAGL